MVAARRAVLRKIDKNRLDGRGMLEKLKNRILESPVGYAVWSEPFNRPKIHAIERMLRRSGNEKGRILDVGCGPATNASFFSDWDYLGVDLNPEYIKVARTKFPGLRFEVADAAALELNGEKFDVVLINSLMHHLNDAECSELLRGIRHTLGENSTIITQEPLTPDTKKRLMRFLMNNDRGDYFRTQEEWKNIFHINNYQIVFEEFYSLKIARLIVGWHMYSVLLTKDQEPTENL